MSANLRDKAQSHSTDVTVPPTDEEARLQALDSYLQALQENRSPDKSKLLARFPDLAPVVDCLESLDRMAVTFDPDNAPTLTLPPGESGAMAPSTSVERYDLIEEIGRGGMGVVFKAWQHDLQRMVALKMILSSHLASREQIERFYLEARAAAGLEHPNIVSIFDVGEMHGQPYFAMQYVQGVSLSDALRKGLPKIEEAARCVWKIARAVAYLHERGYIHRDLKPANILIDANGEPYVTDFGLVKTLATDDHRTGTGQVIGTPSYMSPEQAAGKCRDVGPLSDVYSLGAILYELLTGRPPFRESTPLDTLVLVLEGEPVLPRKLNPAVPPELELICLRCLEKSPEQRYPSAAALANDLQLYLQGEPIESQRAGPWQRLMRWSRRQPALSSHLAALIVVALVVFLRYLAGSYPLDNLFAAWGILGLWIIALTGLQQMLGSDRVGETARFAWCGVDVALLTILMYIFDNLETPIVIGYPLLIAGSGLWFRRRLIWFTTGLSMVAYAVLVARECLHAGIPPSLHHHVIFLVALLVLGYVVSYQVNRVRALSRFYENRQLP